MNCVLIGYRGTGKTTVARHLAERLDWEWIDADVELELRAGKSIAAMFEQDGEPAFRELEARVIDDLVGRERVVIAAGGGVILREDNRRALARAGLVVWLRAEVPTLAARIALDMSTSERRPNLTRQGGEEEIRRLLAKRTIWYQQCSAFAVDTDDLPPEAIAAEILQRGKLADPPGTSSGVY